MSDIKRITVNNIRHIKRLEFDLPSSHGVYLLTGSNGSGKTTLMTCLLRVGWYRAFQDYFNPGKERMDSYDGEIVYEVNNRSVSYHHAGTRWPPTPRRESRLFERFGYPEVRFLPATGNRLYVHDQNINPSVFRPVDPTLKKDLNSIFETNKYDNLRYIQTGSIRGRGSGNQRWKRAYVIKYGSKYYSEKNFSLGEILILNTLLLIQDIKDSSMLLIDELEMALHPRIQIKLLNYLEEKSIEKNLTVIISTHSSSLIKSANRIIYLESNGSGDIDVKYNCYPTLVLKEVAIEEDIQPDYVFMVEDDMAEMLLKEIIKFYSSLHPAGLVPIYKVLPIGGYQQVLEFSDHCFDYLFASSKIGQYIFLDEDVKTTKSNLESKGNIRSDAENVLFSLFQKLEKRIQYLPITPELGIWDWMKGQTRDINKTLVKHYAEVTLNLGDLINRTESRFPTASGNPRKDAKNKLGCLVNLLESRTNEDSKRINQYLFSLFVQDFYQDTSELASLKSILGKIFNTRGNPN